MPQERNRGGCCICGTGLFYWAEKDTGLCMKHDAYNVYLRDVLKVKTQ